MKKHTALLSLLILFGCGAENKESLDYVKLLKIKEAIERGSGNAIQRYQDMIGSSQLQNIESDPQFIQLKNEALEDLNNLIVKALENGVDTEALVECIKINGADSPKCSELVKQVRTNTVPRLQKFDADLSKFIANHLDKNSHLPTPTGDCSAVRIGIFQLLIEGDTMLISRDKDTQIEQFRGEMRKEKVTWINDCEYHLELIKDQSDSTMLKGPGGYLDDSFVEIIRVTDEYYMYKIFDVVNKEEGELVDVGKVFLKK